MNPEIVLHLPLVVDTIRHSEDVQLQVHPYNRATYTKPWFRVRTIPSDPRIEIPFQITTGRYSNMSLFQHLRATTMASGRLIIDGKEIYEAGESQIAGGYRVSPWSTNCRTNKINRTLDFYNVYRKDEHEDYIYGQRRERKIGLFLFNRRARAAAGLRRLQSGIGTPGNRPTALQPVSGHIECPQEVPLTTLTNGSTWLWNRRRGSETVAGNPLFSVHELGGELMSDIPLAGRMMSELSACVYHRSPASSRSVRWQAAVRRVDRVAKSAREARVHTGRRERRESATRTGRILRGGARTVSSWIAPASVCLHTQRPSRTRILWRRFRPTTC